MRIAIDISQIVHPGGVSQYTQNLISHLISLDKENEYLLYGNSLRKYQVLEEFYDSLTGKENLQKRFNHLPPRAAKFLFNKLRFPAIETFTGSVDLFHSSDWTEPKARAKKVTTVHDLAPLIYPDLHTQEIVQVFKRKLSLVAKETDLIIADSQSTKKDLMQVFDLSEERIRVVYLALSKRFKNAQPDKEFVRQLGLKKYILSDAARNPRKNLKNLLVAFQKLPDKEIKLVLLGDTLWAKEETQELLSQPQLKKRIVTTGYISYPKLKTLYKNAECAVFASFYEGFGLNLLEAMSVGCPIVYANVSSLPEVAGPVGRPVQPKEPQSIAQGVKEMLSLSEKKRRQEAEAGRQQVEQFSWEKTAEQTLAVYQEAG